MGCDIHFFVEKKSKAYKREVAINEVLEKEKEVTDTWESADVWETDEYEGEDPYVHVPYGKSFYTGRNYALFGILAGVRWDPPTGPYIRPRGIPNDVSESVKSHYEQWDCDAHTPSYMTLNELKKIQWSDYTGEYVDVNDFRDMDNTIKKMEDLSQNPEDIRCVFWFDN